ncbi:unnamed protein product, partial [Brassica oleracea]
NESGRGNQSAWEDDQTNQAVTNDPQNDGEQAENLESKQITTITGEVQCRPLRESVSSELQSKCIFL